MSAISTSFQSDAPVQGHNVLQSVHLTGNNTINFTDQPSLTPDRGESVGNVHWKVSRRVNTLFTGRRTLLERVKDAIRRDTPEQKIFVITGLGGLGKSEVCLKLVNEIRQE
jgi:hypothetical protein